MTEEEALLSIIQKHQRSSSINDFSRIRLTLELEPWLRAKARSNQQVGGQMKASSNLTEADKLDVRSMIAAAAGVSTGNVNKVRRLVTGAHPDVLEALSTGEVSIHQAWGWPPERQLDNLRDYRNQRGITRTVNGLLRTQRGTPSAKDGRLDVQRVVAAVQAMASEQREDILVVEVKTTGKVLLLSTALSQALMDNGIVKMTSSSETAICRRSSITASRCSPTGNSGNRRPPGRSAQR